MAIDYTKKPKNPRTKMGNEKRGTVKGPGSAWKKEKSKKPKSKQRAPKRKDGGAGG